jgi:hypothetical protein
MKGRRKRKFVLCLHRSNYQPESKCHWFHLLLHSCRSQEEEDEEEQQTNTDPVDTGQTIILRAGATGSTNPHHHLTQKHHGQNYSPPWCPLTP